MTWNMGVHVGPAEESMEPFKVYVAPAPPKPNGEAVNTTAAPQNFQPVPEPPEQTIMAPSRTATSMTTAMSLSADRSIAAGLVLAVQGLKSATARADAETKAINAAVQLLNSRIDAVADKRQAIQGLADDIKV